MRPYHIHLVNLAFIFCPRAYGINRKAVATEGDLKKVNEKVTSLEGCLEAAKEIIEITEMKLKEAVEKLRRSEEEKILLMRQLHQASSMALKIKNDDKQTHLFTGLPSYNVFALILTHLTSFVAKEKSLRSGLTLDNELLVTLTKISRGFRNQVILIGSMFLNP